MQKITQQPALWLTCLLLAITLGCKKSTDSTTPTPAPTTATACQVQKVSYSSGEYELYTRDANGFVTGLAAYYKDQDGKIPATVTPDKLIYNTQGLLDRITWGTGLGYEQYTYSNGALTKIEVFMGGKVVYQIDVTTDVNKRITGLKSTNVAKDPDFGPDYTTKFTLDAQGHYTRLEATGPDGIFYTEDYSNYDPTLTAPWKSLKGIPVFTTNFFGQYGQVQPVSEFVFVKVTDQWGYDDNGKFVGLHKIYDATYTRTANANGYPTSRKESDAVSSSTTTTTYAYNNCN